MVSSLYGAPDVVWYEPGAISVSNSGLIAMTTGGSILFARLGGSSVSDGVQGHEQETEDPADMEADSTNEEHKDQSQHPEGSSGASSRVRLVYLKKLNVHPDKCRSVQFSPEKLPEGRERIALLLSTSTVKVIDYPTMEVVYCEEFPPTVTIKAMKFVDDRPQLLALGFASAEMILVNLANKKMQKSGRLSVKSSQEELQDMDISNGRAVLGCSKGSAAVVDLHTWKVLGKHKMSGQIRAVKWNPSGEVAAVVAVGEKGPLIIDNSDDQLTSYIIPLPAKVGRVPYTDKALLSASVCWAGDRLVVSIPSGTLCIAKFVGKDTKLELISQEVLSKSICTLCPVSANIVITSGIDRVLALWDVAAGRLLRCHVGLAGFVYGMAFHPAGTGVLGVATGNGNVLLAKTDQGSLEQVGKHLQLRSRAYGVAWHPTNEMQLAVATQDGEVLVFDVSPQKTNVSRFRTNQRVGVGSMTYAALPLVGERPVLLATDGVHAYFSKDKEGVLHRLDSLVVNIENHKIWCVSEVAGKNLILFGTLQGKIVTLDSTSLQIVSETRLEKHAVTSLAVSPCGNSVVAVFNSNYFSVFDTNQLRRSVGAGGDDQSTQPVEPKFRIANQNCTACCWSPFDENSFAIGGSNGEVKLFNLRTGTSQRTFRGVVGNKMILTMCWSPIAEQRIYLGTNGNTLYQLDIDKCEDKDSVECSIEVDLVPFKAISARTGTSKSTKKVSLFPSSSNSENMPKAEGLEELLVLLSCEESGDFSLLKDKLHMGFFHKDLIQDTINKEAEQHCVKMNNDLGLQVLLTGGNIRTTVEFAKERKQLDQKLVTLSAFVSKEFFDETVSALIDQNKESDILSVLPFMVATGRIEELLQLLCDRNFHKEAVAVALSHLERDLPVVKNVYKSWAARYVESAQYEKAARCYLVAGERERAIETLTLYHDGGSAATAAICANRCGFPSESLLVRAARKLLPAADGMWLSRLAQEFQVTSLSNLGTLAQTVKAFYQQTKPSDEAGGELFSPPARSLDDLVEQHRSAFSQSDLDFVNKLLEGAQLVQTTDELLVFIVLEVASSLIITGDISEATKVRLSQKIAQFESGKCMHFVMAMLHNSLPKV